jgi:hypothetical protein
MTLSLQFEKPFKDFFLHLFRRQVSNFYIVFGRRGSGKTDFVLLISEILQEAGVIEHFATNTKIYESNFPIERITNLEDLKYWAKETKGKKLFVFDEVGMTIKRRSPMSTLNVSLVNELQVIRKYKLSLLATTIEEINTDKAILSPSVLDGVFIKPSFKNPKVAYFDDRLEYSTRTLTNIPKTSIHFDTWDSAPFERYSKKRKPKFKDEEKNKILQWAEQGNWEGTGLHRMQGHRLLRKYIKENLERDLEQVTSN